MAPQNDSEDSGTTLPTDSGLVQVGQLIRVQRQSRGLSAEQLAATMHMGVEQLTALEQGDEDRLPEPVFIKAMVRRLASHLKMDADNLVERLGPTGSGSRPIKPLSMAAPWSMPPASPSPRRPSLLLLVPVLLLLGGGAGYTLWQVKLSNGGQPSTQQPSPQQPLPQAETSGSKAVAQVTKVPQPATQKPSAAREAIIVEISSAEPSWIALRRGGALEFQGTLDKPRTIKDPQNVEIYAGRPDLVTISVSDQVPRIIGTINDVRWHELIPER